MKKSNRTLLISVLSILVAMLMVLSLAACGSKDDKTAETKATKVATEAVTEAETEVVLATEVDNVASTEAPANNDSDNGAEVISNDELVVPDVTGLWRNENNVKGCTIEISNQNGNTMDLLISSVRGNAAQIATFKITITVTPEMVGSTVRGTDTFEYTDSFSNTGECSVTVSENVITLIVTEETHSGSWGISNATGDYIRG